MGRRGSLAVGLWVLVLAALPGFASAALIEWDFEGVVALREFTTIGTNRQSLEATLSSLGAVVGAPMSGYFVLDTTTPNASQSGDVIANYVDAVVDAGASVGNLHLSFSSGGVGSVVGVVGGQAIGAMSIDTSAFDPSGTLSGSGFFGVEAESSHLAPFQTDTFPEYPPPFGSLTPFGPNPDSPNGLGSEVLISGCTAGNDRTCVDFHGSITRLERVPEPGMWTLLGVAAAALLALRRAGFSRG